LDEGIVAIIAGTTLVAIPLLAISARIALKPIAEAIARLRGDPADPPEVRALQARRIADLEEEVDHLREEVRKVAEAQRFQEQLQGASAPRALREGGE
jgi:hypothetical protein